MEPISHAIVGAGVAALSGQPADWTNPVYIGATLGAVAPDLDIVLQAFGDVVYLRHHRGFSHSLPGVAMISGVITLLLSLLFGFQNWGQVLLWTFLGGLSHTFLDVLNSYGAQILAPFCKKMLTLNLLQIVDPVILILMTGAILSSRLPNDLVFQPWIYFVASGIYLFTRWMMRRIVYQKLKLHLASRGVIRIIPMPALLGLTSWDFVVETKEHYLVGQIVLSRNSLRFYKELTKAQQDPIIKAALETKMGQMFKAFTPYFHISYYLEEGKHIVKFFDLRYYMKSDFLHSATVILDQQRDLIDSFFHPYSVKRNIRV